MAYPYPHLLHLAPKLPRRHGGPQYQFDEEVRLEYYRLEKISEGAISIGEWRGQPLDGPTELGTGLVREQSLPLSRLIHLINERFATDFTDADQLFFDQIVEDAVESEALQRAAQANPEEKFALVFQGLLETLFIERMDQNVEIFARFMNDPAFQKIVASWLSGQVYKRLTSMPSTEPDTDPSDATPSAPLPEP